MAQFSTTFEEYATGVQPSDWTARFVTSGITWSVEEDAAAFGGKVLRAVSTTAEPKALSWNPHDGEGDIEIVAKLRSNEQVSNAVNAGVFGRGAGAVSSEDAYVGALRGRFSSRGYQLDKLDDGSVSTLVSDTSFNWVTGTWYYVRLRVNGNDLKLRVWEAAQDEHEDWDLETTDATHASGWLGVYAPRDTTMEWDYFAVATEGDSVAILVEGPSRVTQVATQVDAEAGARRLSQLSAQVDAEAGTRRLSQLSAQVDARFGTRRVSQLLVVIDVEILAGGLVRIDVDAADEQPRIAPDKGTMIVQVTPLVSTDEEDGDWTLFDWREDEDNRLSLRYTSNGESGQFHLERKAAGVGESISFLETIGVGFPITVAFRWDEENIGLYLHDGTGWESPVTVANDSIPAITTEKFDIGSRGGEAGFDGEYDWVMVFDDWLADEEIEHYQALDQHPEPGENAAPAPEGESYQQFALTVQGAVDRVTSAKYPDRETTRILREAPD